MQKPKIKHTEINFVNNSDGVQLSGTLSLPNQEEVFPGVVLISGSGPQTRDQDVLGHKIFEQLAHHLSNNGIAVLRFDDRGVAQSTGDFDTAALEDFKDDIISAIKYLQHHPSIDGHCIGLIGHSIGGLIAPMVSTELNHQVAFLVSLAGPARIGRDIYLQQHELINSSRGVSNDLIAVHTKSNKEICDLIVEMDDKKQLLRSIQKLSMVDHEAKFALSKLFFRIKAKLFFYLNREAFKMFAQPWFRDWLITDPKRYWTKVTCPVLAISGDKDLQVPSDNMILIDQFVKEGGNSKVETKLFKDLNHIFQKAETGLPEEYVNIKSGMSQEVMTYVSDWINRTVNNRRD